jgi:hypothetical protein
MWRMKLNGEDRTGRDRYNKKTMVISSPSFSLLSSSHLFVGSVTATVSSEL